MFIGQGYTVQKVLFYTKIASSTWYKSLQNKAEDKRHFNKGRKVTSFSVNPNGTVILNSSIVFALKELRGRPFFRNGGGYHKLTYYLKKDYGFHVNHKKVYRLCEEHNLLLPRKKKHKRTGRKVCENRVVTKPHDLWQFDIKYGYVHGENRFFFLMAFIDVCSRKIIDYHIGLHCKASDIVFTLENALLKNNVDESRLVIRSDNGPQMTSGMFRNYVLEKGLDHEFIPPRTPNLNAFIESFFSIIEVELFQAFTFESYAEAYEMTVSFINFYNKERIHGSLDYKTPEEFIKNFTNVENLRKKLL